MLLICSALWLPCQEFAVNLNKYIQIHLMMTSDVCIYRKILVSRVDVLTWGICLKMNVDFFCWNVNALGFLGHLRDISWRNRNCLFMQLWIELCFTCIVYCWSNILLPCHVLNYHIEGASNRSKHRYLCNKLHGLSSDGRFIEGTVCILQLSLFPWEKNTFVNVTDSSG